MEGSRAYPHARLADSLCVAPSSRCSSMGISTSRSRYDTAMNHENLWAPWRAAYLRELTRKAEGFEEAQFTAGPFLTEYWNNPQDDGVNHVIYRDDGRGERWGPGDQGGRPKREYPMSQARTSPPSYASRRVFFGTVFYVYNAFITFPQKLQ